MIAMMLGLSVALALAVSAPPERDAPVAETEPASEPEPEPAPASAPVPGGRKRKPPPDRPRFPRLVIAGGPTIGPHAIGNQECRSEDRRCITAGGFFGIGLQAELRARLYKPLYAHVRGVFAGNVAPRKNDPIYTGIGAFGVGLGAYGRRIFARAEYLVLDAFGKDTFTPPFHTAETGRDAWGHHAGLVSIGFRQPIGRRLALELWGGPMIGPKSVRTIPPLPPERRILPTFLLGINVAFDAWP